jgi:hypothetical protein
VPRSILTLSCLAAVLLAAGCGGSSSGGNDKLTKAELQSRANQICRQLARQQRPDVSSNSKAALDRTLRRIDSALSQLAALHPPAGEAQRYQTLLASFRRSVAFVRENELLVIQLGQQLQANPADTRTRARYEHLVRPFVKNIRVATTAAQALGLEDCVAGFTGGSGSSG